MRARTFDPAAGAGRGAAGWPRRRLLAWLGGLPLLAAGCATRPDDAAGSGRPDGADAPLDDIVPFSISAPDGRTPVGWERYRMRRDIPESRYFTVGAGGATVLRGQSRRGSSGLRCRVAADPAERSWIDWRWRVHAVPVGARADDLDRDDSPARVVLAFDGDVARLPLRDRIFFEQVELFTGHRLPYAMLMYAWDSTLPVGTVAAYPRSGRICTLVVDSGTRGVGHWIMHRRAIIDDFRRVFGEDPGALVSVGVLTDADDLKQPLEADYGDIVLRAT